MKKNRFFIVCALMMSALQIGAIEVTSTAGNLAAQLPDKTVTALSVDGEIDARDIRFIADEMVKLSTLDLSGARIVAYQAEKPLFCTAEKQYQNDKLPELAFFGKDYTSVCLPSTLRSIGKGAMAGCESLKELVLPLALDSIGDYAFNGCNSLVSVSVPASVKIIGDDAFAHCGNLKHVDLSALTGSCVLGKNVFQSCESLGDVSLSAFTKSLPQGMFLGCKVLSTVTMCGESALESIAENTFGYTSVSTFNFAECPRLRVVGRWAFANVPFKTVTLPASVESIGEGAFFYNKELTSVSLPTGLAKIEDYSFANCEKLKTLPKLDNSIKMIGSYAFAGDKNIKYGILPSMLDSIGGLAFANCTGLDSMFSEAVTPPLLGDDVFSGIEQPSVLLYVPSSGIPVYKTTAQWKEFNIKDIAVTDVEGVKTDSGIKAYFDGKNLKIEAVEPMSTACLYDPDGVLLSVGKGGVDSCEIATDSFVGNYYIVVVNTQNGGSRTFKLKRN